MGVFASPSATNDHQTDDHNPVANNDVQKPVENGNPNLPTFRSPPPPPIKQKYCWCLDNGHGSLQPGKRSPVLLDGRQLLEWGFNRDVVHRIIKQLDSLGIAYYNVVPEDHVGSFLKERVIRANEYRTPLKKIFVSIHANAGPTGHGNWTQAHGIETWYKQGDHQSEKIASIFQTELIKNTGLRDRNIKSHEERQFYVLTETVMPAILTENGFYNNRDEIELLFTPEFRQKIADAHVQAILKIERSGQIDY